MDYETALARAQKIHNNAISAGIEALPVPISQTAKNLKKYGNNLQAQLPRQGSTATPFVPPLFLGRILPRLSHMTTTRRKRKNRKTRKHRK